MANLTQIVDYVNLSKDDGLYKVFNDLNTDPRKLQDFLRDQQNTLYRDIIKQNDDSFKKVYGDLEKSYNDQESILLADESTKNIVDLHEKLFRNQEKQLDRVNNDKILNNRKYEMNEWSVNNKQETLFVYSMLFVILCICIILIFLWKYGLIGTVFLGVSIFILLIVIIFTIIYKTNYTNVLRDRRYWNRRNFRGEYKPIPIPNINICPGGFDELQQKYNEYKSATVSGVASTIKSSASSIASVADSVSYEANKLSTAAKSI